MTMPSPPTGSVNRKRKTLPLYLAFAIVAIVIVSLTSEMQRAVNDQATSKCDYVNNTLSANYCTPGPGFSPFLFRVLIPILIIMCVAMFIVGLVLQWRGVK